MINENLKKSPPAGLVIRGKILKKNMVSNDSKSPNSARNTIKKILGGGGKRRRTAGAAVPPPFSAAVPLPFVTDLPKNILFQYLLKHRSTTEFKIYLEKK